MDRIEYVRQLEQRVRQVFREVYRNGVAYVCHEELRSGLGRERATKGFHDDIKRIWQDEMEMAGYTADAMPEVRYSYVPGVNGWAFAWKGNGTADDKLDWKLA